MNVEIYNSLIAQKTLGTEQSPFSIDHEVLIKTLREAALRSQQHHRAVLSSFTQQVAWHDTIQTFSCVRQAKLGECFFWEQPAEQTTLVGIGSVTTIETNGSTCIADSASAWRALIKDAILTYAPETEPTPGNGLVLFGGFAFDPLSTRTQLWHDFPDGLLILPRFLLSYNENYVTLTINSMIQANDSIEIHAQTIEEDVSRLQMALEHSPTIRREQPSLFTVLENRPSTEWNSMVATVVEKIRQGVFEKVVLARDIQLVLDDPTEVFDIDLTLQRLRKSYPTAYVFAIQRGERFFVGATPERLVLAQDGQIHTMALAGSVRRGETTVEDAQLGVELLQSEKNKNEHDIVVAMVLEALKNHCTNVQVSPTPELLKLNNLQHLQTPITGDLIPGQSILDVMANLHPTPAVGGFPRQAALEEIRNSEKLDRGWYAGPLGWIGASGHGEFAVALRSGLVEGTCATLFAGCGIVANSEPQIEYAESWWKFQVMLRGLGGSY